MSSLAEPAAWPCPPDAITCDPGLSYARVERAGDEPSAEPGTLDVAVLDMHHGLPNLGHESIVETLFSLATPLRRTVGRNAPRMRVVSFDVRRGAAIPGDAARYRVVVGTGGPGELDPRRNDGTSPSSQGVREDPSWEAPLFRFFDAVLAQRGTALLGICHSFGLLARWSGAAEAVFRTPERGGKSAGLVTNVLTNEGAGHPWFRGLADAMGGREFKVLDSRLFDLVPANGAGGGPVRLARDLRADGTPSDAVTMLEFARAGDAPRVWGVNFHPEIGDTRQQRERLARLDARGDVTPEWRAERHAALRAWNASPEAEHGLKLSSAFAFEDPLGRALFGALQEAV